MPPLKIARPPIVEAVLDIDCDMSPTFTLANLESAFRDKFRDRYPQFRKQIQNNFQVEAIHEEAPKLTTSKGLQALQVLDAEQRQLVQIRPQGFSFNRLTPYSSLDDYLPEIERAWRIFTTLASPIQVRQIRLRYINCLLLPASSGHDSLDLNDYFIVGPSLPDETQLEIVGFLNQSAAVEVETGNKVNTVLAAQPVEGDKLPVIFDIAAQNDIPVAIDDWEKILDTIQALRRLKNLIFCKSLTQTCLNLFQ